MWIGEFVCPFYFAEDCFEGERREEEDAIVWGGSGMGMGMGAFKGEVADASRGDYRPWKMYPLGVLFGLGFDTSSEIALLGIASLQGSKGTSIWVILIFPVLFTGTLPPPLDPHSPSAPNCHKSPVILIPFPLKAGMCLLDTIDGALMLTLYTSPSLSKDPIAILYYSIVLTAITVVVALFIGAIQLLTLIMDVAEPKGAFWEGVMVAGDSYEKIGKLVWRLGARGEGGM